MSADSANSDAPSMTAATSSVGQRDVLGRSQCDSGESADERSGWKELEDSLEELRFAANSQLYLLQVD